MNKNIQDDNHGERLRKTS